jgi:hypothetical protein
MKIINKATEPTLTIEFTAREAQVVEQALYLASTNESDFAEDCGRLEVSIASAMSDESIEQLIYTTK